MMAISTLNFLRSTAMPPLDIHAQRPAEKVVATVWLFPEP